MTKDVEVFSSAFSDPGSIPGVSTIIASLIMNESIIIAILAVVTFLLYNAAKNQRKKSRMIRKRMVDKARRRE